jgi:hypothetical protein
MRLSPIGFAMSVVLGACGSAVNVGGPQSDPGSGANSSSSGANSSSSGASNVGSSSGPTSSSSGSGPGICTMTTCADGGTPGDASTGAGDASVPDGHFGPGPVVLCPSSFATVPMDQTCTHDGLHCSYPQGQCYCAKTQPATATPLWQCFTPAAGCPQSPPGVGLSCSQPGLACDYGACTGGGAFVCATGSWRTKVVPCPA